MHRNVINMTCIKTKRGRKLGEEEANHKFLHLKMAGKFVENFFFENEIHEKWKDHTSKEFTIIYSGN